MNAVREIERRLRHAAKGQGNMETEKTRGRRNRNGGTEKD